MLYEKLSFYIFQLRDSTSNLQPISLEQIKIKTEQIMNYLQSRSDYYDKLVHGIANIRDGLPPILGPDEQKKLNSLYVQNPEIRINEILKELGVEELEKQLSNFESEYLNKLKQELEILYEVLDLTSEEKQE